MNDDEWAFWRGLLSDTAIRLLKHYGMDLSDDSRRAPMLTDGDQVAGTVLFAGDKIRGGLAVCAPRVLLGIASPIEPSSQISLADFAREIANQILGGIKSRLSTYGLDFAYEFITDDSAPPDSGSATDPRVLVLRSAGGEIAMMLSVTSQLKFARRGAEGHRSFRDLPASGQLIML